MNNIIKFLLENNFYYEWGYYVSSKNPNHRVVLGKDYLTCSTVFYFELNDKRKYSSFTNRANKEYITDFFKL